MGIQTAGGPIGSGERLGSLDAVRGLAVLGILAMNIRNFGLPLGDFDNPRWPRSGAAATGTELAAPDFWTWLLTNLLFEDKMITIFGLLFGAGIVVFGDRVERAVAAGASAGWRATWLHVRRMWWLLVIGLIHAYLLWYGDILNTYALCGLLAWWARKWTPGALIGVGVLVLLVAVWWRVGPATWDTVLRDGGPRPRSGLSRQIMRDALANEHAAYRGSWLELARWRARLNTAWHFLAGVEFSLWRSLGQMLIGMALMKAGLFRGSWRNGALVGLALAGYGLGLTLTMLGMAPTIAQVLGRGVEFGAGAGVMGRTAWAVRFVGALAVALGHVAAMLLAWRWMAERAGVVARRVRSAVESVGRMALTNYLMHTAVCVLIFDGWAGGQWDRWRFTELYGLVAAIWAVQLVLSPLWLSWLRFGPAEWAWRSLTYWRLEPMRAGRP
jgi:uncharacterized protein